MFPRLGSNGRCHLASGDGSYVKKEIGFPVCHLGSKIQPGHISVGDETSVDVKTTCDHGKVVCLYHTHPSGVLSPSQADIREGFKAKVPICIGDPKSGRIRCYRATSPSSAVDITR